MYKYFITLIFCGFSATCISHSLETKLTSHSFSNIVSIKQIVDDNWTGPPNSKGDVGFSHSVLETKYQNSDFDILVLKRIDYALKATPDTASAYYKNSDQSLNLSENKPYQIDLTLREQHSTGIGLGYTKSIKNWQISIQAIYWEVKKFRSSRLTGSIKGGRNNTLRGNLSLREFYTHRNFLKRSNLHDWNTNGYGHSLKLSLTYQFSKDLSIQIAGNDLFNKFQYRNIGFTRSDINTKGSFIDNQGFSSFRPLLQGLETERDVSGKIAEHTQLIVRYRPENLSYLIDFNTRGKQKFYLFGAEYHFSELTAGIKYDIQNRTPEIKLSTTWLDFTVGSDSFNLNKAQNIKLGLNIKANF